MKVTYCRRPFFLEVHIYMKSAVKFVVADLNSSQLTFPRQRTDESLDKTFFILFFDYPKNIVLYIYQSVKKSLIKFI